MATMLSGTAIMDGALLLVAANEPCPQPQTTEHLFAVEIMNLNRVIVVQNKIDLVTKEQAMEQHSQIKEFLKTSNASGPIVPASGQLRINIDAILDYIVNYIEEPERNMKESARMVIIRSFDVNRPGTPTDSLQGGVIGGSLVTGIIKIGDEIEVRPGMIERNGDSFVSRPYTTKIVSLKAERTPLEEAGPGGLIGVGTLLDPSICKSDKLVGMIMGLKGSLPEVYIQLEVSYELFQKTLSHSKEDLREDEQLLLNVGSTTVGANILSLSDSEAVLELLRPCCCGIGEKFAISRKQRNSWRLAGFGKIKGGRNIEIKYE